MNAPQPQNQTQEGQPILLPYFPIQSTSSCSIFQQKQVDFCIQNFSDRSVVIISEREGLPGTWFNIRKESLLPFLNCGDSSENPIFDIQVLLGIENSELLLGARVLAGVIYLAQSPPRPILLSLNLDKITKPYLEFLSAELTKLFEQLQKPVPSPQPQLS